MTVFIKIYTIFIKETNISYNNVSLMKIIVFIVMVISRWSLVLLAVTSKLLGSFSFNLTQCNNLVINAKLEQFQRNQSKLLRQIILVRLDIWQIKWFINIWKFQQLTNISNFSQSVYKN